MSAPPMSQLLVEGTQAQVARALELGRQALAAAAEQWDPALAGAGRALDAGARSAAATLAGAVADPDGPCWEQGAAWLCGMALGGLVLVALLGRAGAARRWATLLATVLQFLALDRLCSALAATLDDARAHPDPAQAATAAAVRHLLQVLAARWDLQLQLPDLLGGIGATQSLLRLAGLYQLLVAPVQGLVTGLLGSLLLCLVWGLLKGAPATRR